MRRSSVVAFALIAVLGGSVAASATTSPPQPSYVKKRLKRIEKTCEPQWTVNLVPNGADSVQIPTPRKITGSYTVRDRGGTIFRFRLRNGAKFCDAYAATRDGKIVFPRVIRTLTKGKVVDPSSSDQPTGYKSVIFFAK